MPIAKLLMEFIGFCLDLLVEGGEDGEYIGGLDMHRWVGDLGSANYYN